MKKRYARAKLIKKESEIEEKKIIKGDIIRTLLIYGICLIIQIFLCLIICREYL